ncbi:MAG: Rrf2 family transcriptional regulator [Planctomycetota bacterium]
MLRISKKADYAVFLLGAIARAGAWPGGAAGTTVVSAQEIARQAKLNKSVVANLLKDFARHGLLESLRGLKGGYRLARPPSQISLGDILEVVEGRFVLVDCVAHDSTMPAGSGLLALAPSMRGDMAGAPKGRPTTDHGHDHDCSLITFCPSKAPMRIVHQRISQLFRDIHLDELCSLAPPAAATSAAKVATAAPARR